MSSRELTADVVRLLLSYDPDTGELRWKAARSQFSRVPAGTLAGYVAADGYRNVKVAGRLYPAHRVAWLHFYGAWPDGGLDHINCMRADNRIANLRPATPLQQAANRRRKAGKALPKGVERCNGRYMARIRIGGKLQYLGMFDTQEQGSAAYALAARQQHGEYARAE